MFRLCAITDEIGRDIESALQLLGEWGLRDAEIHTLWNTSIELLTEGEVGRLEKILADHQIRPAVLDSTVFLRCPLRAARRRQLGASDSTRWPGATNSIWRCWKAAWQLPAGSARPLSAFSGSGAMRRRRMM